MVGIKGYGYCRAAGRAISLIISNALRLAAVNIVGDFLIVLGKLCVCAACGVLAFLMTELPEYADESKPNYLSSPVLPILITFLASYAVAELFFQVGCSGSVHIEEKLGCSSGTSHFAAMPREYILRRPIYERMLVCRSMALCA